MTEINYSFKIGGGKRLRSAMKRLSERSRKALDDAVRQAAGLRIGPPAHISSDFDDPEARAEAASLESPSSARLRAAKAHPVRALDVRPVAGHFPECLGLFDRETGAMLPGQIGGTISYSMDGLADMSVDFRVGGGDVMFGDNTAALAEARAEAAEEATLATVARLYGGLSAANRRRFRTMHGLTFL
jgi:hypothetical protein